MLAWKRFALRYSVVGAAAAAVAVPSALAGMHPELAARLTGMGEHGVVSRVFFPLFGSLLTYGFVAQSGAPGQLPLEELYAELRRYSPAFAAAHPA